MAEYCAKNPCVTSWSSDQAAFCALGGGMLTLQSGCGPYDVAHFQGVDTATDHFYDLSTGELTAITFWAAGNWKTVCVAGPADFLTTLAADAGDSSSCTSSPVDCQKASCGEAGDAACDSG